MTWALGQVILSKGEALRPHTTARLYFVCYLQADPDAKDLDSGGPRPSAGPAMTTGRRVMMSPQTLRACADRSPVDRSWRAPLTQDEAGAKVIEFATMPSLALASRKRKAERP